MKLSLQVISDQVTLLRKKEEVDNFVVEICNSPFWLTDFLISFFIETKEGWVPFVIVIYVDDKIAGLVPLKIKKIFGVMTVDSLLKELSPDIIIKKEYGEVCVNVLINFIFNKLNAKYVSIYFEDESPNLFFLNKSCKLNKVSFFDLVDPSFRHSVLFIDKKYEEYYSKIKRVYRKKLRRIEKYMDKFASWRLYEENDKIDKVIIDDISNIESMSWKEDYRRKKGYLEDGFLKLLLNTLKNDFKNELKFSYAVWFLEINGKKIAYHLELIFKDYAYLVKTSFNKDYDRFSPGIFLCNKIIQRRFKEKKVTCIDFLSDLPFQRTWTHTQLQRHRVVMTRGVLPRMITTLKIIMPPQIRTILNAFYFFLATKRWLD